MKNQIYKVCREIITVFISDQGTKYKDKKKIRWSSKYGIWYYNVIGQNTFHNWFGFSKDKPKSNSQLSPMVQINIYKHGINRRYGGAFAQGGVLVHTGKIGGGKKGVGKSSFHKYYRNEKTEADFNGITDKVALVGDVYSPRFLQQLKVFIIEVGKIKERIKQKAAGTILLPNVFKPEFRGKKIYSRKKIIKANCDHGIIVDDLTEELRKHKLEVGNDTYRDLYIIKSNQKISALFEIKTDTSTSSLYSAIGQLLLNSIVLKNHPKLVIVIPSLSKNKEEYLRSMLRKLRIELLLFKWKKNKAEFSKSSIRKII